MALEGSKIIEAFDREFVMVAVQGLGGREAVLLMGTAEIKESAERAAVFAVLDATNRWAEARRPVLGRSNKIQRARRISVSSGMPGPSASNAGMQE